MYWLQKGVAILTGSVLLGIGVNLFLVPHSLMDGGMIGIGLLATYYMQMPPGLVMILVSIPVYVIVFFYDRRLFFHSFHGMLISAFFIDILSDMRGWNLWSTSFSAVTGGVLIGMGIGLMLAYETNTGGTDLLAQFLARRYKLRVALLIFLIDGLIVLSSIQTIGIERMIFSLLTIVAVAATTHMFSGLGQPLPPYTIIGPLFSRQMDDRSSRLYVITNTRYRNREGEGDILEKLNRKRMK